MGVKEFITQAGPAEDYFYGVGALGAAGREEELAALLEAYLETGHPAEPLYETVLQLYLFAGYPRAINALSVLHGAREKAGLGPLRDYPEPTGQSLCEWRERGEALCASIYGRNFATLQERMRALSPELATWMILEGYGKVLSRPALPADGRECSVIGALIALGAERQLTSHLLGSLNLGVPGPQIREGLELLRHLLAPQEVDAAQALLDRLIVKPR